MAFAKKKTYAIPEINSSIILSEYAILGMIMQAPELGRTAPIEPKHFADEQAAEAFTCIKRLVDRNIEPGVAVMQAEFADYLHVTDQEAYDFLTQIYLREWGIPTEAGIQTQVTIIKREYSRREVAKAANKLGDLMRNDGLTDEEKLAEAAALVRGAQETMAKTPGLIDFPDMCELARDASLKTAESGTVAGISTGLKDLDDMTSGLLPTQLIVLAGRPAMGKTALAMCMGYTAARVEKKPVLMISMEMKAKEVGERFLSLISDVPMSKIKKGQINQHDLSVINAAIDDHHSMPFLLEQRTSQTLTDICAAARKFHADKGGLGLLIVDYLQLISTADMPGRNRTEQVGEISRGLKSLALELDVPVLALSQLNRDVEKRQDRRPVSSDLRESGSIEQDADAILLIYRDEVYNPDTIEKGIAEIIVAKQRSGPIGTARAHFDGARSRFSDADVIRIANTKAFRA